MKHIYNAIAKFSFLFSVVFWFSTTGFAQVAEREPNNTFETADTINKLSVKTGTVNNTGDQYDYFVAVFATDGTLKIYVKGTNNSGANGYLYLTGWDRRKGNGQVLARYISNNATVAAGATVYDTLTIYGRAADTFYFRFESAGAWSYNLSYDILDVSENDAEPNNTFEEALGINQQEEKKGHISYVKSGIADQYDYYRTIVPVDGTLKIYVEATNNSGANGYLYLTGWDKRKGNGQVFAAYISNNATVLPGATITDSIIVYGVLADTFYFRFESAGAFKYKIRYVVVQNSELDEEPNNTFEQALTINQGNTKNGQVGYTTGGVRDNYDYYKTNLQKDGTLKIYIKGTNNSGANGYLYLTGWDRRKGNGQVLASYISNNATVAAGATIYDTLTLYGRAADSFYFRFESAGAWSYSFSYNIIDTSETDTEPNNTFEEALTINQQEEKKGHITYVKNGVPDQYDYYKTNLQKDGTLKIYVKGTNNSGANGYLYLTGWDRRKGNGQVLARYISNNATIAAGATIYDTITITCRAADTFYFRFESAGAFSYNLKYEIIDTSANDAEPNNTFETALPAIVNSTYKGHINYVQNGIPDQYDYYKTILPGKGTVRIIVESTNTSGGNGYLYLVGYDKRKGNGQILARYISNSANVLPGATIRDTILMNCVSIDTFYLRWESAGCFRYSFKVEHIGSEPDANFEITRTGNLFEFTNTSTNATSYKWDLGNGTTSTQANLPLTKYTIPNFYQVKLIASNSSGCNFTDTVMKSFTVKGIERYTPNTGGAGTVAFTVYGGGLDTNIVFKLTQGSTVYIDSATRVNTYGNIYFCYIDLHNAPLGFYNVEIITKDSTVRYPNGFKLEAVREKLIVEVIGRNVVRVDDKNLYTVRIHNTGNITAGIAEIFMLYAADVNVKFLDSLIVPQIYNSKFVNPDTIPEEMNATIARGYPINGKIRGYYIDGIPQGGYKDLRFEIKFQAGAKPIYAWVNGPYSGSPFKPWTDPCFKSTFQLVWDLWGNSIDLVPGLDCAINTFKLGLGILSSAGSAFGDWWNGTSGFNGQAAASSMTKSTASALKNCAGEIALLSGGAAPIAPGLEGLDAATDLAVLGSNLVVNKNQVAIDCGPRIQGKTKKDVNARNSSDPNAKIGPSGYGFNRYINGSQKLLDYSVFFENIKTATLPAQKVIVLDTLDKNVFDLKTFKIGTFGLGTKSYTVAMDSREFIADVNINNNMAVRLNIKLDTLTGILNATFKTIDRATGVLTKDPLAGFLPPNINSPEGDGYINYSIELKDGLSDGTVIRNKASIIFDNNAQITTDVWSNKLDNVKPTSTIVSSGILNDSIGFIKASGNDASSGVETFKIYLSKNGGAFQYSGNFKDSAKIKGESNDTYNFYVLAVDSVGNIEDKSPVSEGTITFKSCNATAPTITASGATTFCQGDSVSLSTTSTATTLQWLKDGAIISGATAKSYTAKQNGSYTLRAIINSCTVTSSAIVVTVNGGTPPTITASGATTFCQGGSVILSTTSTAKLQWIKDGTVISGATTQSYTATQSGSYALRSGDSTCSSTSSAIVVSVTAGAVTPTVTASGATTFCQGGSVILSTTSTAKLQWLKDGAAISGATNQSYTATQSGSYTLRAGEGTCTATSSAIIVTVTAGAVVPTITASGATTFCQGGSVILSTTSTATLQWLKDGAAISGATSQTYTATQSGSYTVRSGDSSCSATSSAIVVAITAGGVAPIVTASGATTFCQGGSVTLSSSSSSGNQWYKDGTAISGATNQTYLVNQSGSYTVITTVNNCSSSPSSSIIVVVNTIPAKPVITVNANTLTSSYATGNQWYLNGAIIAGAINQQYVALVSGQYTVQIIQNGCTSSPSDVLNFTSVNPDPNALSDVLLYPNPVKDKLTIENKANRKLSIRIVNMQGAVVLYPANINTTLGTIDMKKLSRGSYVVEIRDMVTNQVINKIIIKLN